ncbi:hypothetical protein WDU94_015517 [Cyamophila willieti]
MQPLDVSFMGPLKNYYSQAIENWLAHNPGRVVRKLQIAQLLGIAYMKAATMQTAVNGFSKTGILPCNRDCFPESDFVTTEATNDTDDEDSPMAPCSTSMDGNSMESPTVVSPEHTNPVPTIASPEHTSPVPSIVVSPENIRPVPTFEITESARPRGSAFVVTSTPHMEKVKAAEKRKEDMEKKKILKAKTLFQKKRPVKREKVDTNKIIKKENEDGNKTIKKAKRNKQTKRQDPISSDESDGVLSDYSLVSTDDEDSEDDSECKICDTSSNIARFVYATNSAFRIVEHAEFTKRVKDMRPGLQRTRLRDGENDKGFNESILNLQTQLNTVRAAIDQKYIKLYEEHCQELERHREEEEEKANQDRTANGSTQDGQKEPSTPKFPLTNKPPPPPPKIPDRRPSNPQISEEQQRNQLQHTIQPARMNISQTNEQHDQIIRQGIMDRPPQVVLTSTNGITTQAVSTVKIPTINPPSFDGTGDIEEFLKGYNLAATLNNWGAELKAQCLPIHIKGPAKTFYENNIEGKDTPCGGIEALLRRQFTPMGKEDYAEHRMRSRIQGQSETAEIYVQDKINLINKYDKNMAEASKVRLVMYGLLPDILARVSPMEGNYTLEGLKLNIENIELAFYRVNLRVNGIRDDAPKKEGPPNWASDLINVVKNIEEKSNKIVNNNNSLNDSFNREVQHLRNEMQDIRSVTNHTQPCDQAAIITPDQVITSIFPCDATWTKKLTIQAIIPEVWTNNTEEVTEVIQNNELQFNDKMKILLTEGWEVNQKFNNVEEAEQEDPDTVTSKYAAWKTEATGYVVEWTTILTVLILVILFRESINIGLIRIVERKKRKAPPLATYNRAETRPLSPPLTNIQDIKPLPQWLFKLLNFKSVAILFIYCHLCT